ncbi:hypothetical protein KSS87_002955, partial [Heliosperma pusillum]
TNQTESRKPAWRWLGYREGIENTLCSLPLSPEPKKRTFGTDLSNISSKRTQVDYPVGEEANSMKLQVKTENVENEYGTACSKQYPKPSSRSCRYGPFAPVTIAKVGVAEQKSESARDLESLATSYRPQYYNQAVRDLFEHYAEAWKSWYSEVAGRTSLEQVS